MKSHDRTSAIRNRRALLPVRSAWLAALALGVLAWSLWAGLAAGPALAQHGGGGGGGGGGVDTATGVAVGLAAVLVLGGIVTAIMIDARRNAPGSGEPPKPRKRRAVREPAGSQRPSDAKSDLAARSRTAQARKAES